MVKRTQNLFNVVCEQPLACTIFYDFFRLLKSAGDSSSILHTVTYCNVESEAWNCQHMSLWYLDHSLETIEVENLNPNYLNISYSKVAFPAFQGSNKILKIYGTNVPYYVLAIFMALFSPRTTCTINMKRRYPLQLTLKHFPRSD